MGIHTVYDTKEAISKVQARWLEPDEMQNVNTDTCKKKINRKQRI